MKRAPLLATLCVLTGLSSNAAPPGWWSANQTRILNSAEPAQNYAPANLGQLKHAATQAKKYLDKVLFNVGGAGATINNLVASFEPRQGQGYTAQQIAAFKSENYAPVNLGQVKAVAKPFYDRLLQARYSTKGNLIAHGYPSSWSFNYPWNPATPVAENYAAANLGQLKMVFSFEFGDTDGDGLPDFWELMNGLDVFNPYDTTSDLDGDGVTAAQEFTNLTDALKKTTPPPLPTIPAAPSNFHVQTLSDGSRFFSWDDNSNNEDYFIIRDTLPDGTTVELGRVGPGQTTFYLPAAQ